jgi:hypothetical protein
MCVSRRQCLIVGCLVSAKNALGWHQQYAVWRVQNPFTVPQYNPTALCNCRCKRWISRDCGGIGQRYCSNFRGLLENRNAANPASAGSYNAGSPCNNGLEVATQWRESRGKAYCERHSKEGAECECSAAWALLSCRERYCLHMAAHHTITDYGKFELQQQCTPYKMSCCAIASPHSGCSEAVEARTAMALAGQASLHLQLLYLVLCCCCWLQCGGTP